MYSIRKKFKFEMAHLLDTCYSEECQNIHGHSYVLEVFIQALGLNADGMIIDFKKLKEIVQKLVIDRFDHSLVLSNCDKNRYDWVSLIPGKKVIVGYNPTAENMTRDIYDSLFHVIAMELPLTQLKIRLHETDTGYAEYRGTK
jgi:6-pyruvoyltetrahydropterin/6-carboxytetrahydropterin synthase